jgi:DNA primase
LSKNLVLAFDADTAGIASAERASALALERGMQVKVVRIPTGKDPADCIRESKELWKEGVKSAQHIVDFLFDHVLRDHKASARGNERDFIARVRTAVLPVVTQLHSATEQAYFVRTIANKLGIAEDAVWQDVRILRNEHARSTPSRGVEGGERRAQSQNMPPVREESQQAHLERALSAFLFWHDRADASVLTPEVIQTHAETYEIALGDILTEYSGQKEVLAFEAEVQYADATETPLEIYTLLLRRIARIRWVAQRDSLAGALREAERENDDKKANAILLQFQNVSQCIEKLAREEGV